MKLFKKIIKNKYYVYLLFLIPIICFFVKTTNPDNDIWFLLNSGRYVLNKGIPYIEPFTIHEGLSFVMQQWLSSLIFWIVFHYLGKVGLYLFIISIGIFIMLMYYKLCKIVSNNKIVSIILTSLTFTLLKDYIVSRPQVFTYLILISEMLILEKYIKTNNKKTLYILPIFSLLLINLHASMWFMQFAFLLPYIINGIKIKSINKTSYQFKPILLIILIMGAIGFINPYGYKSITYIFNSYGVYEINNFVGEMKNLVFNYYFFKFIIVLFFFLLILMNYNKKIKFQIRYLLLFFGTSVLAFMNVKGIPYFFITFFFSISSILGNFNYSNMFGGFKIFKKRFIISICYGLKIGVYSMLIFTFFYTLINCFNNIKYENYLKDTADYIIKNDKISNVRLYVGYNDGGYMEYRGFKSYIDPRAEVFLKKNNKKEDIFHELYTMYKCDFNYSKFIKKYNFNYLLVYPGDKFYKYLKDNKEYELVFKQYLDKEKVAYLYKRSKVN